LDLVADVHDSGKKFKMTEFEFRPVGVSGSEFKVVATAVSIDDAPSGSVLPNISKTKPGSGGGLPGEKPAGTHLTPPPPPPPPR
jgi:hypothetical protein